MPKKTSKVTRYVSSRMLMNNLFNLEVKKVFSTKNLFFMPGSTIKFTFDYSYAGAYTRPIAKRKNSYRICLGGGLVSKCANLPSRINSPAAAKGFIPDMDKAFKALYFHEIGHLIFTDMYDDRISKYPDSQYIGFIHSLYNLLEDVAMERYGMSANYPYTTKYFNYLVEKIFLPQCSTYKDTKKAQDFLNFLLLKFRCGKKFSGYNEVYDTNKSFLVPALRDILVEPNSTERITKSIALAEWLIKNTSLDFTDITADLSAPVGPTGPAKGSGTGSSARETSPSKTSKTEVNKGEGSGGISEGPLGANDDPTIAGSSNQNRTRDSHIGSGEVAEAKKVDELPEADFDNDLTDEYDPKHDLPIGDCPEINDAFNDVLGSGEDQHIEIIARDYFEYSDNVIDSLNKQLVKLNGLALGACKAIKVFKARIRPRYHSGYPSGKLCLRSAMQNEIKQGCETNLFQRKIKNGVAPDLAISVLCDNSGSMSGNKSRVCTYAMLALAQACNLTNVPIEISCFTEDYGISYTIRMKQLNETLEQSLPYLGITHCDIIKGYNYDRGVIPTFCGNEDEVNLNFIYKNFLRDKHKDKIIIVISDGETCGSTPALRNLITQIESSGIRVIGLGIQSRAVSGIYPNHYLFDSEDSLNMLPEFLSNLLLKLSKGGK